MMVVGLLLAQPVLPGPPSGPIQPPGMICLGECAGPVVWGPAERGRLVVACDMRSDTCSDGRQITTTRSTPVPCEVSPGVWEMVGPNEGCYGVRGLESWAATTSYVAYGAELDRSPWGALRGGTIEALADGYRVTSGAGEAGVSGRIQVLSAQPEEGSVTLSCIVRTQQPIGRLTLEAGTGVARHFAPFDTAGKWERVSVSGTIAAGAARWVSVGPGNTDLTPASVDVKACWLTHTSTPGRPCWGGEAPVTCAADRHTISTEGWPTESGSMRFVVRLLGDATENRAVFDVRADAIVRLVIQTDGRIRFMWDGSNPTTPPLDWEYDRPYVIESLFNGSTISMYRDGVFLSDFNYSRPVELAPTADLASAGTGWRLNGSISSLTVRSYEEVSP